ncbi:MAG: ATP-binding protein [Anaerolineales bacterium]
MLPDFRLRQRDYLLEITRAITEELEHDKVLARIVRVSAELLAGHAGLIALREEEGWRIAASTGIHSEFLEHLTPLLAEIPDHGEAARFEIPEVNRRLQRITQAASQGLLTGVGLPMMVRGEVVGVIFVFRSYRGVFSAEDRALLQAFADQAAIAVHNARLYTQVSDQKQRLDAVLESSADGIMILDPSFRIVRMNPAAGRLLGLPPERALGRRHDEIVRWAQRASGMTLEEAGASGWPLSPGVAVYVEGDLRMGRGVSQSVGITYAPILAQDGRLSGVVANLRDITRFREAEELKSTFISVISHELRTPVALIKGYAGTLRREDAEWDPEVVRQSLTVIEEEADHLASLIDDLLDASRLQAGGLALSQGEVDLAALAMRLVDRFRIQSPAHKFESQLPPDFPIVIADEARLNQVLANLISNAVKYSPEGGTIRVQGQARPDEVTVCVIDEGPGIETAEASRIFDRFYRSAETARKTQGAGLGLYLARAVVEAHGGRIWVDQPGRAGARICFSLPRPPA